MGTTDQIEDIVEALGLAAIEGFRLQEALIRQAFLHSSYCMENAEPDSQNPGLESYQRLEFLGDAILGFLTAERLYRDNPSAQEGELTRARASLVREKSLAAAATVMGLGRFIKLGKGIAAAGGAGQPSVLADIFEALLGAVYLCGATMAGLERFVMQALTDSRHLMAEDDEEDFKGQLQEWIQRTGGQKLSYTILEEKGPDHQKQFLAAACLDEEELGRGWGKTKQEAQKAAAKLALRRLQMP